MADSPFSVTLDCASLKKPEHISFADFINCFKISNSDTKNNTSKSDTFAEYATLDKDGNLVATEKGKHIIVVYEVITFFKEFFKKMLNAGKTLSDVGIISSDDQKAASKFIQDLNITKDNTAAPTIH